MFAVIKTGGKQYRVAADDLLKVERLAGEPGEIIVISDVLAVGEGDKVTIGTPFVEGASVAAEVVDHTRGPKVIAFKKRRRQNSRRKRGHRQLLTTVRISEILLDGAKPSKKAAAKPAGKDEEKPAAAKKETKPAAEEAPKRAKASAEAKEVKPLFTAPEGEGDDLTKIKGIGPVAAGQLREQGLTTFAQLAGLSDEDIARIDAAMPFSADQIKDWREQAKTLAQ
ncbi:50S ribosomal protein L21 [Chelativorans sp. SCAU2101]|uniref:Large ribosomal subunit protein bL21 n=1 Tax=Chelativorans petroleitrophicus TaxID=2975484 RepID=A0A9X2XAC9_9HYPH|nr:50S ribosomal protein L21 [Chelativorans petroleitrophicus]MCT8991900.1 50S ribosomal protein L21 [Chelativorans petroleitrophicus]